MEYKKKTSLLALLVIGMSLADRVHKCPGSARHTRHHGPAGCEHHGSGNPRHTGSGNNREGTAIRDTGPGTGRFSHLRDLVLAAAADAAFLHEMNDNGVYSGIYNLGNYDCDLRSASG